MFGRFNLITNEKEREEDMSDTNVTSQNNIPSYHNSGRDEVSSDVQKSTVNVNVPQPETLSIPTNDDKKKKIAIATIITLAVMLIIGVTLFFVLNREEEVLVVQPITQEDTWTEEEAQFFSARTLDLLGTQRDEFNFNTTVSECTFENNVLACAPLLFDHAEDGIPRGVFRESLAVIWADFKLFERTRDPFALERMQEGIDSMIVNVIDDEFRILQTDRLACALLRDIANSTLISQEYRDRANYICTNSLTELSSHSTLPSIMMLSGAELQTQTEIHRNNAIQNLSTFSDGGSVTSNTNFTSNGQLVTDLQTQLFALLNFDYRNSLPTRFSPIHDQAHTMLFLDETIEWYFANYQNLGPREKCLMMGIIDIYGSELGFFGLSQEARNRVQYHATQNDNGSALNQAICSFVDYYLDNGNFNRSDIVRLARNNNVANNYIGDFSNDDPIVNTFLNALIAGLLQTQD
ncbi:MAG: hypothetical protein LBG64_03485 [Pseudomonadales bacterium]|nr:hypothetical protein [Pseudomonadales bacterium]